MGKRRYILFLGIGSIIFVTTVANITIKLDTRISELESKVEELEKRIYPVIAY